MYLLDKIGATQIYKYLKWNRHTGFVEIPIRDFDTSKYLTPEIRQWLEAYMILPEITEDAGDE